MEKLFAKLSLLLLLAITVCLAVGVGMPYWVSGTGYYSGLWTVCFESPGARTCIKLDDNPGWVQGVRAVEIMACLGGFAGVILLVIYNIKNDGQANLNRIKFVMFLCLISCIMSIIGVILYGSKHSNGYFGRNNDYDWSFIVTAIAGSGLALILFPLWAEIKHARRLGTYESI